MNKVDWVIVVVVGLTALGGYKRGLIGTVLWFVGSIVGAIVGARVAPHFLSGGSHSQYTALIGLLGAVIGIGLGQMAASIAAGFVRNGLRFLPPLHLLDSLGGAAIGALWGLLLVWVAGTVALQIHGHQSLRREVKHSKILHRLNKIVPPHDLLNVPKQIAEIAPRLERLGQ